MTHTENSIDYNQLSLKDIPLSWRNIPQFMVLVLIRFYQRTISRILPPDTCRFYPSCSHYGFQAIAKYGIIRGGWMAIKRILRCHPFHPGGYDPVP
jgi:putative membrane protein insertion efficiency factor